MDETETIFWFYWFILVKQFLVFFLTLPVILLVLHSEPLQISKNCWQNFDLGLGSYLLAKKVHQKVLFE